MVDVDPRNFAPGDDPLHRLGVKLGLDWSDYPTVVTGSGGRHIYMSKPEASVLRNEVPGFAGIEFKSVGRQVVAAGSLHPVTLNPYLWDEDPLVVPLRSLSVAPAALIELACRERPAGAAVQGGEQSAEQLELMLEGLDPEDFAAHDKWLGIMMACHHATGGAGREAFIDWSIRDPRYSWDSENIGRRWDSLSSEGSGSKVTQATLFRALIDAGRHDLLPRVSAQEDFACTFEECDVVSERAEQRFGGVLDEWVYVVDAEQFVRRSDGKKWKKEQWKAQYVSLKKDGDVLGAIWKGSLPMRKFESLVYLPGEPEFPEGEAGATYNIWRPSGVAARLGDVGPFLDHLVYLFSDEGERNHVLDYLAMLVQNSGQKVNYALLVKGVQGTGKSWIGQLMTRIIGDRNVTLPSNSEVMSQWTAWTEGAQLGIIEELMAVGRLDMANRLKPIITEPTLRIESKGVNLYSIPNRLNLIAFTNHDDAVPLERGDRRWLVVYSDAKPLDEAYFERLFAFLDGDGPAAVKHWLLARQVMLNPKGVAPGTKGKDEMRLLSMGDAEQFLTDLMEEEGPPFDFPLVRFEDVLDAVPYDIARQSRGLRNRVTKWLTGEAGAVKHSRYKKQDGTGRSNSHLWSMRDHEQWETRGASARMDAYHAHRNRSDQAEE